MKKSCPFVLGISEYEKDRRKYLMCFLDGEPCFGDMYDAYVYWHRSPALQDYMRLRAWVGDRTDMGAFVLKA